MKSLLLITLFVCVLSANHSLAQDESTFPLNSSVIGSWNPFDNAGRPYLKFTLSGVDWPYGWPMFRMPFENVLFAYHEFRPGMFTQTGTYIPANRFFGRPERVYPPSDTLRLFEKPDLELKPSEGLKTKNAYHLKIYF